MISQVTYTINELITLSANAILDYSIQSNKENTNLRKKLCIVADLLKLVTINNIAIAEVTQNDSYYVIKMTEQLNTMFFGENVFNLFAEIKKSNSQTKNTKKKIARSSFSNLKHSLFKNMLISTILLKNNDIEYLSLVNSKQQELYGQKCQEVMCTIQELFDQRQQLIVSQNFDSQITLLKSNNNKWDSMFDMIFENYLEDRETNLKSYLQPFSYKQKKYFSNNNITVIGSKLEHDKNTKLLCINDNVKRQKTGHLSNNNLEIGHSNELRGSSNENQHIIDECNTISDHDNTLISTKSEINNELRGSSNENQHIIDECNTISDHDNTLISTKNEINNTNNFNEDIQNKDIKITEVRGNVISKLISKNFLIYFII